MLINSLSLCNFKNVITSPNIITKGVIFANGNSKGACLEHIHRRNGFRTSLAAFTQINFIDDSKRNCDSIADSFNTLQLKNTTVWHYNYIMKSIPLDPTAHARVKMQESYFLAHKQLIDDAHADALSCII